MTIREFIQAVCAVRNEEEARAFYSAQCRETAVHLLKEGCAPQLLAEEAERITKANIGWCFGEGLSRETIALWRRAIPGVEHPVVPHIEDMSAEDIFAAGQRMGEATRKKEGT